MRASANVVGRTFSAGGRVSDLGGIAPSGQLALVSQDELVPIVDAQRALDGAWYAVDGPPAAPSARETPDAIRDVQKALEASTLTERHQLAFDFGDSEVQQGHFQWRKHTADAMEALDPNVGGRMARRFRACGTPGVRRCVDCGTRDHVATVYESTCQNRACPACQRVSGRERRKWLVRAMEAFPVTDGRQGRSTWWFDTLTVRRPAGTSIRRLQDDARRAWSAWREQVWPLWQRWGAERSFAVMECSPGGVVHLHAIVYGPWVDLRVHRPELDAAIGRSAIAGSPMYRRQRVTERRGENSRGIKGVAAELAKYTVKSTTSESIHARQTHPILAAMVALAWRGMRRFRTYGDWKGFRRLVKRLERTDERESDWACPSCGSHDWAFQPEPRGRPPP